jgi:hypothetical protein
MFRMRANQSVLDEGIAKAWARRGGSSPHSMSKSRSSSHSCLCFSHSCCLDAGRLRSEEGEEDLGEFMEAGGFRRASGSGERVEVESEGQFGRGGVGFHELRFTGCHSNLPRAFCVKRFLNALGRDDNGSYGCLVLVLPLCLSLDFSFWRLLECDSCCRL